MKSKYIAVVITALLVVAVSGIFYFNSASVTGQAASQKPLKIGMQIGPASTLLMVAKEKGFFEKEGLNVELEGFTAGKFALQAFLAGSLDLAASGEIPVMLSSMQGNKFYVITQLSKGQKNEVRVVAVKETGLDTPDAYFSAKKRKLATSFGGGPEFYTYNFLKFYNITNVELVSQKPEDIPVSLASGSVDAVAVYDPFAFFAEQKLGDKAIVFGDEKLYTEFYVLSAKREWVDSNPETVKNLIRALVEASDFIKSNSDERKAIISHYLKLIDLESHAKKYPADLSGGQRQRVAIARAFAPNPDIVLMDEPFGALDIYTRDRMQKWLLDLWEKEHKTIIFVTHYIDEAIFLSDRIIVMKDGKFIGEFNIKFKRPRKEQIKFSREFSQLKRQILNIM